MRPPIQTDVIDAAHVVRTPHLIADRATVTILDGVLAPPLPANATFTTLVVTGVSSLGPTSVASLGVSGAASLGTTAVSGNFFVTGNSTVADLTADDIVATTVTAPNLPTQAEVTALQTDVGTLQTDVTAAEGDIATLQTDVGTLQTDVTAAEGNIATLQTDVGTLQTDVTAAEGNIATLQTDVGTLQTDVTAAEGDIATLQTDVGTLQTDVGTLQTDVTAAEGDIVTLQADVAALPAYADNAPRPAVRVTLVASGTAPTTYTNVGFDTVKFSRGGLTWNTVQGSFTPPTDGYYLFNACVTFSGGTGNNEARYMLNGSTYSQAGYAPNIGYAELYSSITMALSSTDIVTIQGKSTAASFGGSESNWVEVVSLG